MVLKKLRIVSAISPEPGNFYTGTVWFQPRETVHYSLIDKDEKDEAALQIRALPYGWALVKLTWAEFVNDATTAQNALRKDGKKKYESHRVFTDSNLVIGYRTEYVPFFKEVESHPYVVEVTSAVDGVSVEIVINVIIKINHSDPNKPLKLLSLDDPFGYVNGFINEAIVRWAAGLSSKEIRKISPDEHATDDPEKKDPEKLNENPFKKITINGEFYLKYLNEKHFAKYELEVTDVNLKMVVLTKRSKPVADAEQDAKIAESKKMERLTLNEAKAAENKTELEFIQGQFEAKSKFLQDSSDALHKVNQGYAAGTGVQTLFVGETGLLGELLLANKAASGNNKKDKDRKDDKNNKDRRNNPGNSKQKGGS